MQTATLKAKRNRKMTIPLTDAEKELIYSAAWTLWQEIGHDAEAACEESGVRLRNADAAEFVLDARRLESDAMRKKDTPLLAALAKFRVLDWKRQVKFILERHTFA